ncbi:MAG: 6,7-dimethyl-8-ribityllumazine synthase [Planctomyces sp.]|jgi:6,7-dimethyl-8-ribityllumazine synthase|nr:6,7-dimethyl-8-ribityllumazine synthase [Planctomyces sp.]
MTRTIEATLLAPQEPVAIVVSRFNELVTNRLLEGAVSTYRRHGLSDDKITVVYVPGSFELPVVAQKLAQSKTYGAVICLGAVIQGETTHHEYINQQVAAGLQKIALETGVPVAFGVLTCPTMDHALDRSGGKAGNKGVEAALAAIETRNVLLELSRSPK